ncbi:hypothetical protein [Hyphomonas atlantica]|uniref:hypothetical protein n=1 Tax=Hyphomonas atlantica TaxID=1280948 RepID=UPI003519317B
MQISLRKSDLTKNTFVFVTIIFLYLPLANVAGYNFTFGTAAGFFVIMASLPLVLQARRYLALLFLAWVYPLVIYVGHLALNTRYALGFMEFTTSYGIWVLSSYIVWLGFQPRVRYVNANWTTLLALISGFAVLQFIDNHYGTQLLTTMMIDLGTYNPLTYDRSGTLFLENFRAIGTYYEPSMLGRIAVTIGAIILLRQQKLLLVSVCLLGILYVSKSFSVMVLGVGMYMLLYTRLSLKHLGIIAVGAAIILGAFGDFILDRLALSHSNSFSSSYIRLIMPYFAVKDVLPEYFFGVPIGGNERVVQYTIATIFPLHEPKITNGLYEFVILFGFPALGLILGMLWYIVYLVIRGERAQAVLLFFLLLSTAASSSYINIESSLLLYFLIANLRMAQVEQAQAEDSADSTPDTPSGPDQLPASRAVDLSASS